MNLKRGLILRGPFHGILHPLQLHSGACDIRNAGLPTPNCTLFIFMSRPWAEPAGVSHKEQVGSSSATSSHYQHGSLSERGKPPGTGAKPISKTFKIPVSPLARSLNPLLSSFYSPSLYSLQRRGEGDGGYLTLICSIVSSGEMTCNLRGKGQLFLFPPLLRANLQPLGTFF